VIVREAIRQARRACKTKAHGNGDCVLLQELIPRHELITKFNALAARIIATPTNPSSSLFAKNEPTNDTAPMEKSTLGKKCSSLKWTRFSGFIPACISHRTY
jgi:hypothetical protein